MAHSTRGIESGLRKYLIEQRSELRALFTNTLLDHSSESAKVAWTEMSKTVDPLLAGEAVGLRRYELPDDHRERQLGDPLDWLVLGADDHLTLG